MPRHLRRAAVYRYKQGVTLADGPVDRDQFHCLLRRRALRQGQGRGQVLQRPARRQRRAEGKAAAIVAHVGQTDVEGRHAIGQGEDGIRQRQLRIGQAGDGGGGVVVAGQGRIVHGDADGGGDVGSGRGQGGGQVVETHLA